LYWYDKPAFVHNEPELEFWDKIPATWDETKVIDGFPGEYITTARRSGNDWFIGTITNNEARDLKLNFGFLPKGQKYLATIYRDDASVQTNTHVGVQHIKVDSGTTLTVRLAKSGGQAIWLTPDHSL
jgi:hypothetical protein